MSNSEVSLLDKCTQTVHLNYPMVTGELFALMVAHELFHQLRMQTVHGPSRPFDMLCNAQVAVGKHIEALMGPHAEGWTSVEA